MKKILIPVIAFVFLLSSCAEEKKKINESIVEIPSDSVSVEVEKPKVSFYQYEDAPEYPDAILELFTPLGNQVFKPGKVPFEFNIKNYPFEEQGDKNFKLFNILNGGDPTGFYAPIFQRELTEGSYRVVAYLVDKDGLALKNFGNYVDRDFQVGDSRPFPYSAEPYLALNYPRNQQRYAPGEEVIIDFLVVGGDMQLDGLLVEVQANDFSYQVDHMAPILISNLPAGVYQVEVSLKRNSGNDLDGPFSQVNKTIIVE
ncbi:hypothetical protein [Algoriphagus namhaensis]